MRAMVLTQPAAGRLEACERELPVALPGELLVKILACGVCRTDLHIVDGELPASPGIDAAELPLVPGHEIVGLVAGIGDSVEGFVIGDRIGIPWLAYTCGQCAYCRNGRENLCPDARFTGYHSDGGYADFTVVDAGYSFKLPAGYSDVDAAPLLCAGLIGLPRVSHGRRSSAAGGRRSPPARAVRLRRGGAHHRAGGAARGTRSVRVHVARRRRGAGVRTKRGRYLGRRIGRAAARARSTRRSFSRRSADSFLKRCRMSTPAGVVVCAGIHMSDVPSFPYRLLWQERIIRSVANLTRQDARDFLALAAKMPIKTYCRAIRSRRCEPRVDQSARRARPRRRRAGAIRSHGRTIAAETAQSTQSTREAQDNAFSADSAFSMR